MRVGTNDVDHLVIYDAPCSLPGASFVHLPIYGLYQGNEAKIDIEKLQLMVGLLPGRALGLALDWAELHQNELRANGTLAQQRRAISNIEPLE